MTDFFRPKIKQIENTDVHFYVQTGELGVNVLFGGLNKGIVSLLEQFGSKLYFGYPHRDIFLNYFYLHKRHLLIHQLKDIQSTSEDGPNNHADIALHLYLSRVALSQKWKYPALLNRSPGGGLVQATGGSRAFAMGLTKPDPWKHFPVLMLEDNDKDPGVVLVDPVKINSDRELTELLGGKYDPDIWDPTIQLTVEINKTPAGNSYVFLKHVDDHGFYDRSVDRGRDFLEEFKAWRDKNPGRPALKIYTNYPQNIRDINGCWDKEIVGDTGNFEFEISQRRGWSEKLARDYHSQGKKHGNAHVLWLVQNRVIDLGDFLPWMDIKNTTYANSDWDFVLYRPDDVFSTTFIDVSYQQ